MPRKKNALEFFRRGKDKGSEQCREGIDGSTVHNKPTDKVLREYRRMIDLWNQYGLPHVGPAWNQKRCCWSNSARQRKLAKSARSDTDTQSAYDWRHIYNCYKKSHNSFAELCFLCNEWVFGEAQWSHHCQAHLDCPETLPVQCDPLVHGGVLAAAGYCMFCMADPSLLPEERLRQFLDRGPWKSHVHGHYEKYIQTIDDRRPVECPHPSMRCVSAFDSAKHLKFHLLDVHCPDFIKEPNKLEMLKEEDVESDGGVSALSVLPSAVQAQL